MLCQLVGPNETAATVAEWSSNQKTSFVIKLDGKQSDDEPPLVPACRYVN